MAPHTSRVCLSSYHLCKPTFLPPRYEPSRDRLCPSADGYPADDPTQLDISQSLAKDKPGQGQHQAERHEASPVPRTSPAEIATTTEKHPESIISTPARAAQDPVQEMSAADRTIEPQDPANSVIPEDSAVLEMSAPSKGKKDTPLESMFQVESVCVNVLLTLTRSSC